MTDREVNALNRRIEILYRSQALQEPAAGIARAIGCSVSWVEKSLVRARRDRRVLDGARKMAEWKQKQEVEQHEQNEQQYDGQAQVLDGRTVD